MTSLAIAFTAGIGLGWLRDFVEARDRARRMREVRAVLAHLQRVT